MKKDATLVDELQLKFTRNEKKKSKNPEKFKER